MAMKIIKEGNTKIVFEGWCRECGCHHHGNYYAVNDWELCLEDALKYALENLI